MRWAALAWALAAAPLAAVAQAAAADTVAPPPTDVSVTVYRAPNRGSGSIDLDRLEGFALISETRTVHLPAGLSQLRFEGVADGIESVSAIVTGLPAGVIEKNREGKLLSPSALIAATVGKPVTLLRADRKTGKLQRLEGTLASDAGGGVVFRTAQGIEALRCSGLPETFSFSGVTDLKATPTLSVMVRNSEATTRTVTLSYLARGFDWAADYIATLSGDGKTLDLGAWVTLANGNGVGFPAARAQVVAGRVNRANGAGAGDGDGDDEPLDAGSAIFAQCWPRGSTGDAPQSLVVAGMASRQMDRMLKMSRMAGAPASEALAEIVLTARRNVEQEQLGDLKLYRIPDRTTVASRQSKQVRLLDRLGIPVSRVYGADLAADDKDAALAASVLLRTVNNTANHLGLPLPSGRIAVFAARDGQKILLHESGMRDLAVDEELEIDLGESPDVQVAAQREKTTIDPAGIQTLPLVPGVTILRSAKVDDANRVVISNARAMAIPFELRLRLPEGGRIVRADHPLAVKNGRPIFRLKIPANESVTLRYQTQHTVSRVSSEP
jgi:hypothetical protein